MKASKAKQTLFVWLVVVVAGSLYTQFLFKTLGELWMVWGFLITVAIILTAITTEWDDPKDRYAKLGWVCAVLAMFGYTYWAYTYSGAPMLFLTHTFLWWSVLFSLGYMVTGLWRRWRDMTIVGVASLLISPLFWPVSLAVYHPLLFGVGHALALGYVWWRS